MTRVRLRPISFEEALKLSEGVRFTMESIPKWYAQSARRYGGGDKYYAPQFRSDREWYDNTRFIGEPGHYGSKTNFHSINWSFPLGVWLDKPYVIKRERVRLTEKRRRVRL